MSDRTLEHAPQAQPPPDRPRRRSRLRWPQVRWTPRRVRRAGTVTGVLVAVAVAGLVLWLIGLPGSAPAPRTAAVPANWVRPAVTEAGLAQRSGVRIKQVAVTAGGGLVDLRYQVLDPDKAGSLHDAATPPAVVDEQTGLVVHQLFMGHSHSGPYQAGVTYYLVFENPGNWVRRGSLVTVLLGDAQVEHVVVR